MDDSKPAMLNILKNRMRRTIHFSNLLSEGSPVDHKRCIKVQILYAHREPYAQRIREIQSFVGF